MERAADAGVGAWVGAVEGLERGLEREREMLRSQAARRFGTVLLARARGATGRD